MISDSISSVSNAADISHKRKIRRNSSSSSKESLNVYKVNNKYVKR